MIIMIELLIKDWTLLGPYGWHISSAPRPSGYEETITFSKSVIVLSKLIVLDDLKYI